VDLDVAAGQQAAVCRVKVAVIACRTTELDSEPIRAPARLAVVLHMHVEGVAGNAVDGRGALDRRVLVIDQDADERDRRAPELDVLGCVLVIQMSLEAVVPSRLNVKVELAAVADPSAAGYLAGTADDGGAVLRVARI
jgi:hypothetical protein